MTFNAPNGNRQVCPSRRRHPDHLCPVCGTLFYGHGQRKYCSRTCAGLGQRQVSEKKYQTHAFDQWSSEMSYALGLFFSDGSLYRGKRGSWRVMFDNTDLNTVLWWHAFLGNPNRISRRGARKKVCYVSITTSDTLGERLVALGAVPRKSTEGSSLPSIPEAFIPHFLRGYFDGDGGIWTTASPKSKGGKQLVCQLTCNPEPMREALSKMLSHQGVGYYEDGIQLRSSGSDAERLCLWMYGEDGPSMTRKKSLWEAWREFRGQHGGLICQSDPWETLRGLRPEPWHRLVGTKPDRELAIELGMSRPNVALVRKKLGIPPCPRRKKDPSPRPWHPLVGKMPDADVATMGGISKAMVCTYRKTVGIPSFQSQKRVS